MSIGVFCIWDVGVVWLVGTGCQGSVPEGEAGIWAPMGYQSKMGRSDPFFD